MLSQLQSNFWICHRRPDRSLFFQGQQLPVCARCTGIWLGYALGIILLLVTILPWWIGPLLIVPAAIDAITQFFYWRQSSNPLRIITGIGAGIGEIVIVTHILMTVVMLGYQTGIALS